VVLLTQSAQERVVGFLLEMANRTPAGDEVELPMLRRDIADYLGPRSKGVTHAVAPQKGVSDRAADIPAGGATARHCTD
jgi:hypothetical protein